MDEIMKKVEAVLFSSENPMRVGEIGEIIGHDSKEVSKAVKKLRKEYENRGGAIEIAKIGNKYVMQLK
ncbi:MAG TPA: SMC-Scp complex subunit ScpB, partial [Candidatus Aciduliprofundum boonei]|nr:SMC-Scp complex subunit ScpB [Candidatus Aciduliprofundum boonei]